MSTAPYQPEEAPEGVVNKVDASLSNLPKAIDDKFTRVDNLMLAILAVLAVMVLTLIFMVVTLLMDALRFNSVTYREYSAKLDTLEDLRSDNNALKQEIIESQRLISEQQTLIIQTLGN